MNLKETKANFYMDSINILITGINGFVGSSLRRYIKREYPLWKVYGIDKGAEESKSNFRLHIEDKDKLKKLLLRLRPRYIYHMCGNPASKDFKKLLIANVYSTFMLLDTIKEMRNYNPRIIIPSSAAEYGAMSASRPLKESELCNPLSFNGFSKALQTELSLMFARGGLDIVIARIFNIIGYATPCSLSIGRFARELALIKKRRKKSVLRTKNLDTRRDFIDINDACKYLALLAIYGKQGEIYNICRGKSYRIRYLLNKLLNISGIKGVRVTEDKECGMETNPTNSVGLNKKLKKLLRESRFIPIDQSLRDTYSYYLSRV